MEWKVIYVASSDAEAQIVIGRLANDGIRAWTQQEPAGSAIGITVGELGAVRVLVRGDDYERAAHLLSDDATEPLPDDQ
jgi:hypothetical protein